MTTHSLPSSGQKGVVTVAVSPSLRTGGSQWRGPLRKIRSEPMEDEKEIQRRIDSGGGPLGRSGETVLM